MSIALGNMYAKFWKPLCMKFVRLVANRFESTFVPRRSRICLFLAAEAARLDEVITRYEKSPKSFRTIIKLAKNRGTVIYMQ